PRRSHWRTKQIRPRQCLLYDFAATGGGRALKALTGKTVLVVDDDPELRELITLYLRDHQLETIEAGGGLEAIKQCRSHRPDLVLLDVMMPDLDGYETARMIRAEFQVPIIFLTSKMEASEMVAGLEI